jgi:hypothetical protein
MGVGDQLVHLIFRGSIMKAVVCALLAMSVLVAIAAPAGAWSVGPPIPHDPAPPGSRPG